MHADMHRYIYTDMYNYFSNYPHLLEDLSF